MAGLREENQRIGFHEKIEKLTSFFLLLINTNPDCFLILTESYSPFLHYLLISC